MRTSEEMKQLISDVAQGDERIRAVLLNGSRANSKVTPDALQDFDIVYMVSDLNSFTANHKWTEVFGEKLIQQLPQEMYFGNERETAPASFTYLMLFRDGNRIDLTLFPIEKLHTHFKHDSLTIVWVDKDNRFPDLSLSSDEDYYIQKPSEKEFADTCNEFWWVSTYVAKALVRNELVYAHEMMDTIVRKMFLQLLTWSIAAEHDFAISTGASGKFIKNYLSPSHYQELKLIYANGEISNCWKSLFSMTNLFQKFAPGLAVELKFPYKQTEAEDVLSYLENLHNNNAPGN